jgi:hypothetical protein
MSAEWLAFKAQRRIRAPNPDAQVQMSSRNMNRAHQQVKHEANSASGLDVAAKTASRIRAPVVGCHVSDVP